MLLFPYDFAIGNPPHKHMLILNSLQEVCYNEIHQGFSIFQIISNDVQIKIKGFHKRTIKRQMMTLIKRSVSIWQYLQPKVTTSSTFTHSFYSHNKQNKHIEIQKDINTMDLET